MQTGRNPTEHEDRDQSDAFTCQGMSNVAGKLLEAKAEAANRFSLIASEVTYPSDTSLEF